MKLRPYQFEIKTSVLQLLQSVRYALAVLPTGGGKTVVFSDVIKDEPGPTCAIAHRQELVSQISIALARDGVRHNIIGPKSVVKLCVALHMAELGKSFFDPNSKNAVAGVDTLLRRTEQLSRWMASVKLWVIDEAHHLLKENKWGKAVTLFPNAKGIGVTATPERADGKGLGSEFDGVFDDMIIGPSMRDLINMGYLTDYRIFAPKTEDLNLADVTVSKTTGDYNPNKLKTAIRRSHVIGDVVSHYLKIAAGKLGVTFATDVETATDIAQAYNNAGVPAAVVSAKTPDAERIDILRKFRNRELLQLVNVDLFGEGFDLPAIEVVSMARPTQSYGLYVQQFGRACRLLDGKEYAIIIDHVGNVQRHGLPDAPRQWTLEPRSKRSRSVNDAIPVTACPECTAVYERIYNACPHCGFKPEPVSRSSIEFVDGDLLELDFTTLAQMRGEIEHMDRPPVQVRAEMMSRYAPEVGVRTAVKRHVDNQEMQRALRASIAWWGGYQKAEGYSDSESYRQFYFKFGVDIMTAQTLKRKEAEALATKINYYLGGMGNVKNN